MKYESGRHYKYGTAPAGTPPELIDPPLNEAEAVFTVPFHVGQNIRVPRGSKVTEYDLNDCY